MQAAVPTQPLSPVLSTPEASAMPTSGRALRWVCAVLVFLFPAISVVADDVGSAMFFLLAILGLVAAFYPAQRGPMPRALKLVLFALVFFFAVALVSFLLTDLSESGYKRLGRYARFLLVVPLYFILRRAQPSAGALWYGVTCGALLAGLVAMDQVWWQILLGAEGRAHGTVNPIIFGNMSLLLAALSLASLGYFAQQHRALVVLPLLSTVMGMAASFLSGSRGGWLALPALAVVFLWYARRRMQAWQYLAIGGGLIILCAVVYYAPQSSVRTRIDSASQEFSDYFSKHLVSTSIGARLEMSKAALLVFREHPLLGAGMGGFARETQELIGAGRLDASIAAFNHPHNEYVAALATRGMVGLASLLLLFGIVAKFFYDLTQQAQARTRMFGLAGLIVVVCYAHFGITGDTFDRTLPITFFTFLVAVLTTLAPQLPRHMTTARAQRLSVIIVAKNEADRIEACLQSVAGWADEIIVLDSGSHDATVAIAQRYTPHVDITDWPGFGPQKQRALERARGAWVLSIDADERVSAELRAEIDAVLAVETQPVGFCIPWQVISHGQVLDFGRSGRAPLRLFRRAGARFSDAQVHEHVILPPGSVGRLQSRLIHDSHRDFHHALNKFTHYAWLWAQQRHGKGRTSNVPNAVLHAAWMFLVIYFIRLGLLDGRRGFLMSVLFAQYTFNKHAALWTLGLSVRDKSTEVPSKND